MRPRGMVIFGIILISLGVLALISSLTNIDFGAICFPTVLILLGIFVLMRPRMVRGDTELHFQLLGDVKRMGAWTVVKEEIWSFIGDIDIDLSQAQVPAGETTLHAYNFIGDVEIYVPAGVGLAIVADGFLNSVKWMGSKQDNFLTTTHLTTEGYEQAERKVRVEVTSFIGDIKVHPGSAA
jgi:predicted membrane protein